MNSPVQIITPGVPWISLGSEEEQTISAQKNLVVIYPDSPPVINILCCTPAQVVNTDGTLTSPPVYFINRLINTWLLISLKNVVSIHPSDQGIVDSDHNPVTLYAVLLVPEYLSPNFDTMFGDSNYGILARCLNHDIKPYQNV